MKIQQEAFFLPVGNGHRFCIWRAPAVASEIRGLIVHVPAFAEEMNKARRMTAWSARDFAAQGYGVLQIDLFGCGDSSGDFGDATWEIWVHDVVAAVAWVRTRGEGPLWLWGLRAGALLCSAALPSVGRTVSLLLWQPVLSGTQHLTQFLRMKLAADMVAETGGRGGVKPLREALQRGLPLEIAGYQVSPKLAAGLDSSEFAVSEEYEGRVVWLEITSSRPASLSPVALARIAALKAQGLEVAARVLHGPSFWQTVEIEDCPELIEASVTNLRRKQERELSRHPTVL
ncbi:MAG: hydrolase 2, exosortase A system-associated [Betaproteobacteria bacterium]|nr:hydrolase 2, exosortase A system-associated [Betaproteobacteria bacterium]